MINESNRALRVRAEVNQPLKARSTTRSSRQTMTVTLDSIPDALMIPSDAIIPQLEQKVVYRISQGKAEQVQVKTGVRLPKKVQITEGLSAGDSVLVSGLLQVALGYAGKGRPANRGKNI
ncbi:MAG: hypothetical protein U5L96_11205 [Owenweeksia sp.]|nr:hypothetical protein [Owenweeksia sp.]